MERKEKDGTGDFKDIHKHKNDIYRLTTILIVPNPIKRQKMTYQIKISLKRLV